jgi:hypothetical protein
VEGEGIRTHMKNTNDLGRDIYARMKELMRNIKSIQMDLELLEKNDGIISLQALYSVGAVNSNYYRSFGEQDKEEVWCLLLASPYE